MKFDSKGWEWGTRPRDEEGDAAHTAESADTHQDPTVQFVKEFLTLVSDYQNFKKQVDERLDYFRSLDGFNSFSSSIEKVLY